jgi:hypothetical protein
MTTKLWDSFRDELIATSMVFIIAMAGSFYFAHKLTQPPVTTPDVPPEPTQTQAQAAMQEMVKVLGEQSEETSPTPLPTPTPAETSEQMPPLPSPTGDPYYTEVFYGVGGLYDYDSYRLEITSPRIVFDARNISSRKMIVDMVLYNKTVEPAMSNKVTASIVKDGVVIVPETAMSLSETVFIKPQEKITFQARISLIESTDVKQLFFKPDQQPPSIHMLLP